MYTRPVARNYFKAILVCTCCMCNVCVLIYAPSSIKHLFFFPFTERKCSAVFGFHDFMGIFVLLRGEFLYRQSHLHPMPHPNEEMANNPETRLSVGCDFILFFRYFHSYNVSLRLGNVRNNPRVPFVSNQ